MMFTPAQAAELVELVDHYHLLFAAGSFGTDFLTPEDIESLNAVGIDTSSFEPDGALDDAFRFGLLSMAISQPAAASMTYQEFRRFLKMGGALPLTAGELTALAIVKRQAYHDLKGLGNKIGAQVGSWLIEADRVQRHELEEIVREKTALTVERRETQQWLASQLGHATTDWTRDWDRIAEFLTHSAFDNGRAEEIRRQHGPEAIVYKQVYPLACKECVRILLTAGPNSEPRTFTLRQLVANGTNVGRPRTEWRAVLGSIHPWCRCTLHYCDPKRYDYDPETGRWSKRKPSAGTAPDAPKKRRGTIKITINGKTHDV